MRIINFLLITVALLCVFQQSTAKTSNRLVLADSLKTEQSFQAAQDEKNKDEKTGKVELLEQEDEDVILVKPEVDVDDLPAENNKLLAERETNLGENGYDQDTEDNEKVDLEEVFESRAQRRRRTRGGRRGRRGNRNRRARRGRPGRRGRRTLRGGNRRFRRTG